MQTLTQAQSNAINNSTYTHNYAFVAGDTDSNNAQFEADTGLSNGEDIGGITVYFNSKNELIAFFDYELDGGTVFAQAVA